MHLYINPKKEFLQILNFEQACYFGSKQAIQKQWSLYELMKNNSFVIFEYKIKFLFLKDDIIEQKTTKHL